MKKLIVFLIILNIFSLKISAEEFYGSQYDLSGITKAENILPKDTKEILKKEEISPQNPDFVKNLTTENVFKHIWGFVHSGAKEPIKIGALILAVILISAAVEAGVTDISKESAGYATVISAGVIIAVPLSSVITAGVDTLKGCSVFMTSFVPIFAAVTAAGGKAATAVSMSALLLGAAEVVSYISSFVIIPLMTGYLSISLCSAASPILANSSLGDGVKKLSLWIMGFISTVFVGVLSIQTSVNSSADTLTSRTAKFIVGTTVPVAGNLLSEALTTVTASMGLLKATMGIYGVIATLLIFLPLLIELILWRIMLNINATVSDLFSLSKISGILRSADSVLSVLVGIIILSAAIFVISLSVVVSK